MSVESSATPPADNPILNNPYDEPRKAYQMAPDGSLDYSVIKSGRRPYSPDAQVLPKKVGKQKELYDVADLPAVQDHLINRLRKEVGQWRADGYPNTTRVTRELLLFWFENKERLVTQRLFFAQREALETAVWLNEVAPARAENRGTSILAELAAAWQVSDDADFNLPRLAFKMATGTGKTVVMAMLTLYHYFNRQEYRQDTRFADYFLFVTPGVTIRDRLGVLYVDTQAHTATDAKDYYRQRGLVPPHLHQRLAGLNARLVLTNYHAFEPKQLQGNKRSPFDGKKDPVTGLKVEAKEDFGQVIRRLLGSFRAGSRLLVLNDEAHHCYLPKAKKAAKAEDGTDIKEENERAAVWYRGLVEIGRRFKLQQVYDLSATPYYLSGSGYTPYSLFSWVCSDFGLIEAIESGLVKIPYLPEGDDTQDLQEAKLRDIYAHVKHELPKRGSRTQKLEGKPELPTLVKTALHQFYEHYEKEFHRLGGLFSTPPVLILVCNNTNVSSEVFKYIAGYETATADGEPLIMPGQFELLTNFDRHTRLPRQKPPTLIIDSSALDNSDQVDEQFKRVFGPEIERFKQDYRIMHPGRSVENLTDGDLLREVVNTVGKTGSLGSHVRCVVSVSMLTEGWDANTVTHIMGLRAFGSQLLCEQVAGRALRRQSYNLVGYDKEGQPTKDKRRIVEYKFPPEYAHIIGVPFKLFRKGAITPPEPPKPLTQVHALPDRRAELEILFPMVEGYRLETGGDVLRVDFSAVEPFIIEGHKLPTRTRMSSAFSEHEQELNLDNVRQVRLQQLEYYYAKLLLSDKLADSNSKPRTYWFGPVRQAVGEWLRTRVSYLGGAFPGMIFFYDDKAVVEHIGRGIWTEPRSTDQIRPVFSHYNDKVGTTSRVRGATSREVYPTTKSHVNYVVMDSEWEGIAAKELERLEEMTEVEAYVKNDFLGFSIPYVSQAKERRYFPDFIVRCRLSTGQRVNVVLEISGMAEAKTDKRWYVTERWLPAVNNVAPQLGLDPWHFLEIANDIRNIRPQLQAFLQDLEVQYAANPVPVVAQPVS
ncbi:DEAD/DEAH box helicase family protein [Hymenobacter sp. J193]|uniref:BPTD_3080 family restriction endonuclease n=1 Tax=Hymenobacter sp. J193 TaxID=2898429 RepID=UPI002151F510|nr:DEAD/DEAH box helicase family protein [Hymenobacter sp. J193]MCR5888351.1 DEAD/DEAH box helicase family protein [Hymenobacter sp. J193]